MTIETREWIRDDVDRSQWGAGPWDGEPDKKQWQDEATGFACLAVRHPDFGNWCGYVGVVEGHPWHGKSYNDLDEVEVHGGLTFAAQCQESVDPSKGVCHVADAEVWWLGFDCNHGGDEAPGMPRRSAGLHYRNEYRTLRYVAQQCASLARQAAEAVR